MKSDYDHTCRCLDSYYENESLKLCEGINNQLIFLLLIQSY